MYAENGSVVSTICDKADKKEMPPERISESVVVPVLFAERARRFPPLRRDPRLVNEDFDRVPIAISQARNALRTRDEHSFRLNLSTEEKFAFRR